jgi:hypothetical protein
MESNHRGGPTSGSFPREACLRCWRGAIGSLRTAEGTEPGSAAARTNAPATQASPPETTENSVDTSVATAPDWTQVVEDHIEALREQIARMQAAQAFLEHTLVYHRDSSSDGCPHYEALIWQRPARADPPGSDRP